MCGQLSAVVALLDSDSDDLTNPCSGLVTDNSYSCPDHRDSLQPLQVWTASFACLFFSTLFYGWVVTACAFVVLFVTYGVQYSFGVFLPAMLDELDWQRASLGGAFSLYTMVYSGCSWISGRLTDTAGPRWVVTAGGLLLGSGIIATSQMTVQWQLYLCYGLIAALGMSSAYIPCNTTVVKWFQRKRGLALGLAASGSSCGILLCPWVTALCIARWGWRPVYFACGLIILVLLPTLARFMVRNPEQLRVDA